MTKRLRVPAFGLTCGETTLSQEASRYVVRVHRKVVGDALLLFDSEAKKIGLGTLAVAHQDAAVVLVEELRPAPSEAMPVMIFQALGKGDKPDQAVRDATVLGASHLVMVRSERSVAKASGEERGERLRRIAVESARQAERNDLPELAGPLELEEALALVPPGKKIVLGFDETARPLVSLIGDWRVDDESVSVFVGPEGGFSKGELERLKGAGFALGSLGPLVLRTEVALTVALGALRLVWDARRSHSEVVP